MNRDLLVAVLAVLTDAIPRSALATAIRCWTEEKGQSLAEWLKQSGGLDDHRIHALECLASAHLKAHENDLRQSLSAWNAFELTQGVLTEIHDEALRTTIGASLGGSTTVPLNGGSPTGSTSWVLNPAPRSPDGERFERIRPHARGGIGQVWLARDCELQRNVALKEIQPCFAEREDQRARFVLEAEITGNLEHPGIVPVYSLGRSADGRPYYAMRFIQGESFSLAIKKFHEGRRAAEAETATRRPQWGVEFRHLLGRFLDVCDAMDYAHSRGVIHRDLKPANIMLGKYGETLVVDWGLAKVMGKDDVIPAAANGEFEPSMAGCSVTTSGDTQPGTTIGTPPYMSPEQARGDLDNLGYTSDVYSLGATLYELLTGQVPFPGKKLNEVVEKVLKREFQPPRAVDRSIPAPLEAICLKAMEEVPERRYSSVRQLAQDLEHWLADEPVAAYPERRLERFGRWLRQHRTATHAAAAALIGVTVVAITSATIIEGGRRREADARKEAEASFKMAQKTVEDYLTSVSENTLLKIQDSVDLRGLRQELLSTALKYYKSFVNQRGDDPNLRQQLANAYFRVGEITQEIDSRVEAIEAFHSARKIWEPLAAADPDDHELQSRLAACDLALGKQKGALGDLHGAMTSFNQARAILEPLAARYSDLAAYQSRLADCYSEIGIIQGKLQAGDRGLASLEKARAIQQHLIDRYPSETKYRQRLAEIINVLGFVYGKRLDNADAIRCFEEVQKICQSLLDHVTDGPKPVKLLDLLALSHYNIATIRVASGQFDLALDSLEKSLEYRSELAAAHPSVTKFRENVGKSFSEIADVQRQANQDDKAFSSIQSSIDILDKLVQSHPDQATHHGSLGRSLNTLGYLHDKLRHNSQAIPVFEKAVKEQELAISQSPDYDEFKVLRCVALENLGEQYVDLGQVDQALPYYRQAIQTRRQLFINHPEKLAYLLDLAEALCTLGTLERHAGDSTAARVSFEDAKRVLEGAGAATVDNPSLQIALGVVLVREAGVLADLKQPEKARAALDRAVKVLSETSAIAKDDAQRRDWLSEGLWELARILRDLKNSAEANSIDARRVALWQDRPTSEVVALALKQAGRAAMIGYGKTPIAPQAEAVRQLDRDEAASNLRLAFGRGFADIGSIRANPDAALLLLRGDVKSAIKD
jgi:serine/threonine-protein kinase